MASLTGDQKSSAPGSGLDGPAHEEALARREKVASLGLLGRLARRGEGLAEAWLGYWRFGPPGAQAKEAARPEEKQDRKSVV